MNRRTLLCFFLFFAAMVPDVYARQQRSAASPQAASSTAPPSSGANAAIQASNVTVTVTPKRIMGYSLSPELYRKAKTLGRIRFSFRLFSFIYGLVVLWFILQRRYSAKFRNLAESVSRKRYVQALIYVPLLILTIALLQLPLDLFNEVLFKRYGISIQSWSSWAGDWFKIPLLSGYKPNRIS
jgi:hypothetical protein